MNLPENAEVRQDDKKLGYVCVTGYELSDDGKCVDIDECDQDIGVSFHFRPKMVEFVRNFITSLFGIKNNPFTAIFVRLGEGGISELNLQCKCLNKNIQIHFLFLLESDLRPTTAEKDVPPTLSVSI